MGSAGARGACGTGVPGTARDDLMAGEGGSGKGRVEPIPGEGRQLTLPPAE